jgi:predicted O-methyltransferase YrrM
MELKLAYHGYLPLVKQYVAKLPHVPSILEVGVDRGVSYISLVAFLARTRPEFLAMGVDILIQEQVQLMVANLDLTPKQSAYLIQGNSLEVLPKVVGQGLKFDVLLLDGDHNYHTVSKELEHLEALTQPHSIVIIDDYDGRWAEKDLWYAERPGYEEVKAATPRVDTDKHGVKAAVDEYLATHSSWKTARPIPGEPIVLARQPI